MQSEVKEAQTAEEKIQTLQTRQESLELKLKNYESLTQTITSARDKLKMEAMIPIGEDQLAFMPGEIIHTNEWLVLLGDNYFVKCTASNALGIVQRRKQLIEDQLKQERETLTKLYGKYTQFEKVPQPRKSNLNQKQQVVAQEENEKPDDEEKLALKTATRELLEGFAEYQRDQIVEIREDISEHTTTTTTTTSTSDNRRSVRFADEQPPNTTVHQPTQQHKTLNKNELNDVFAQLLEEEQEQDLLEERERQSIEQKLKRAEEQKKMLQEKEKPVVKPFSAAVADKELENEFSRYFSSSDQSDQALTQEVNQKFQTTSTTQTTSTKAAEKRNLLGTIVEREPVVKERDPPLQQPKPPVTKKVSKFKQMMQQQ